MRICKMYGKVSARVYCVPRHHIHTRHRGRASVDSVLAAAWSRLTLPLLRTEQCTVHVVT